VKCPICRAIEKPSNQVLETHISLLKKHIKDIEAKLLEKQVIEINLREQLRNQSRNPPTIPRAEVIDLVEPRANTSNILDVVVFLHTIPNQFIFIIVDIYSSGSPRIPSNKSKLQIAPSSSSLNNKI
jgi:hypothetical protein